MYKDGVLTISDWQKGMAKHPIAGFGLVQNAEVFENKGLVTSKRGLATSTNQTNDVPIAYVVDIYGNFYYATRGGNIYKNGTNTIVTGLGNITDIKVYKNYLWVSYNGKIGAYGPLDSVGALWFPAILTGLTTDYKIQLCVGQDDFLYATNGNYIAKIEVTSSGTIGVAPVCGGTTSITALDLPDGQYTTCITEFGTKIVVGTVSTNGGGRLYSWNRLAGTLGNPGLADLPVIFNENGVWQLYSHRNKLYVTAGLAGNVYISDGSNYRKLAQIPFSTDRPLASYFPNAICISEKGNLLIANNSSYNGAEAGVWEITDNGEVVLAYTLVTGKTSNNQINIGFLHLNSSDNKLSVGWGNGNTYGIDEDTLNDTFFYVESPFIQVGTYNNKKTFQHIEFTLADTFSISQTITLAWRKNLTDNFTTIGTYSYNTVGAISGFEDIAGIADCEFIQIKITGYGTYLLNVKLR